MLLGVTGTFVKLAVFASLSAAGLYFLGCLAAWMLRRRRVALAGTPLALPALPLIAIVGMVSMAVIVALAHRDELAAFAIVVIASAAFYAFVLRRGRMRV